MSLPERFFSKVNKNEQTGCWEWCGAKSNGYGYLFHKGKVRRASHMSLLLHDRELKKGMKALHSCDNPSCVNPDHLFEGTQKDNLQDASNKGRCGAQQYPEKYKNGKPPVFKGEENPASKLTAVQVAEIRSKYSCGAFNQTQLASFYAVSQAMISLIVRREKWK